MGWGENDRGVSFTFGAEVVAKFLHKHDFDLICRAHQVSTGINKYCIKLVKCTIFCCLLSIFIICDCILFNNAINSKYIMETFCRLCRLGFCLYPVLNDSVNPCQVVEDGYEFFAKRQLVTLFSAPNYCGEFDNAGAMMSVDETLMCSFQILKVSVPVVWKWRFCYLIFFLNICLF